MFIFVVILVLCILCLFYNFSRKTENFTAPGLTLLKPPEWFPQNSAKAYNKKDWETPMYLDRYPFRNNYGNYDSYEETNKMASAYKFWKH